MITLKPLKMRVHGVPVVLTEATQLKTNQWYADNAQGCIDEVVSGEVFCNNVAEVVARNKERKESFLSGSFDLWLGYYQQACFIQTGEMPALLS